MNEGVGGAAILMIIMIVMAIIMGYAAFNVNYTKAFRMKNKIISLYEEYGDKGKSCSTDSACIKEITDYAKKIGYAGFSYSALNCSDYYMPKMNSGQKKAAKYKSAEAKLGLYCIYTFEANRKTYNAAGNALQSGVINDDKPYYYYRILTRIDIKIPVVEKAFNLRILNVSGDTRLIRKPN